MDWLSDAGSIPVYSITTSPLFKGLVCFKNKIIMGGFILEKGKVLSTGVGYGYAYNFGYDTDVIEKKDISLEEIIASVKKELDIAFTDTENLSEEEAMIFDAHSTLLQDEEFIGGIRKLVSEGMSMSQAIMENGKNHAKIFLNMEDKSLSHIAEDIMDITYQMADVLRESTTNMQIKEPVVLCCENIYPSNLLNFISNYKLAAIISKETSELSHSAIIARGAQIPFITNVEANVKNKMPVIVNADENEIIFNPNYQKMMEIKNTPKKTPADIKRFPVKLKLNAGNLKDILSNSKTADLDIGLFRSEYFYLQSPQMPEDEAVKSFVNKLFNACESRVIDYRLPDFGRDKLPLYLENKSDISGMEFLIDNESILKQQLRILKSCNLSENIRILLPYVKNVSHLELIKNELASLNISIGCMIECILEDNELKEIIENCDFINLGTNDLICDLSQNDRVTYINSDKEYIDSMFEYINKITELAHAKGSKVCICGEIASDEEYFEQIVKSGVDSVSVSSFHILNK